MKKLLLFLLITTIAYASIEEYNEYDDDVSLVKNPFTHIKDTVNGVKDKIKDPLKPIKDKLKGKHPFEKIKARVKELQKHMKGKKISLKEMQRLFKGKPLEIFKKLPNHVQNGIHWLKVNGYWEPLKEVVKNAGKVGATSLCSAYLTPIICGPVIGFLFEAFVNKL